MYNADDLGIDFSSEADGAIPAPSRKRNEPPKPEPAGDETEGDPAGDDAAKPILDGKDKGKAKDGPADPPQPVDPATLLDKDDQPFVKAMSPKATQHFAKKIVALKEQLTAAQQSATELQSKLDTAEGKKLPDAWYEHERAFELSPQYTEISQKFQQEAQATHFWDDQLRRCKANSSLREGQAFIPYQMLGADGKLVTVTEDHYSAEHELTLDDHRQHHYRQQEKLAAEADKIGKEFGQNHKKAHGHVRSETERLFPFVKDQKHPLNKTYNDLLAKMPSVFKGHALTELAGALAAMLLAEKAARKALEDKQKVDEGVEEDQRQAGPIPGRHASGKKDASEIVYKPEDLTGL